MLQKMVCKLTDTSAQTKGIIVVNRSQKHIKIKKLQRALKMKVKLSSSEISIYITIDGADSVSVPGWFYEYHIVHHSTSDVMHTTTPLHKVRNCTQLYPSYITASFIHSY